MSETRSRVQPEKPFDPEVIVQRAEKLVRRHPAAMPIAATVVRNSLEVLDSIFDDFELLGGQS